VIRLHNSVSTIVIIMRTRVEGATINAISGSEGVDRMKYPRGIKQSVSNCRNCHRSAHPSLSWNRNPLELATHPLCPLSRDPPYAAPHLSSSAASPPLFSARSALRQLTRPATFREEVEPNSHRRDTGRDRAKGKWSSTYRKDIVGGMEMARGSTTEVEVVLTVQSRGRRVRVCQAIQPRQPQPRSTPAQPYFEPYVPVHHISHPSTFPGASPFPIHNLLLRMAEKICWQRLFSGLQWHRVSIQSIASPEATSIAPPPFSFASRTA